VSLQPIKGAVDSAGIQIINELLHLIFRPQNRIFWKSDTWRTLPRTP